MRIRHPLFDHPRGGQAFNRFCHAVKGKALDIGSGPGEHVRAMRAVGIDASGVDVYHPADYRADYMDLEFPAGEFDGIWCNHTLEHQLNVNAFLKKVRHDVKPGGLVSMTVPPLGHRIVGGHVTLWNEGLLLYNMIVAGFDCREAVVGVYGPNISVLVRRKDANLPALYYDKGDIELLAPFFPMAVSQGFEGRTGPINW